MYNFDPHPSSHFLFLGLKIAKPQAGLGPSPLDRGVIYGRSLVAFGRTMGAAGPGYNNQAFTVINFLTLEKFHYFIQLC